MTLSVSPMSPGRRAIADAIAAAGPGRHYLHIVRPVIAREVLAEVLYLGGNRLALGPVSAQRLDRLAHLVDMALSDTTSRCGSFVLSLVSDVPTGTGPVRKVTRYVLEDGRCTEAGELNRREYGACSVTLARMEAERAAEDVRVLTTLPSRFPTL